MKSIKTKLIVVILATITLLNFVAAIRGYNSSINQTDELFDKELQAITNILLDLTLVDESGTFSDEDRDIVVQVWSARKLMYSTKNAPKGIIVDDDGYGYTSFSSARWRVYRATRNGKTVIVGEKMGARYLLAENIIIQSVLPIIFLLPLLGIIIWWVVAKGMAPIDRLSRLLALKKFSDLKPIREDEAPYELEQFITSINSMLARLEASFSREKQFSSDAAHELRTPLSGLKINLHNLSQEVDSDNINWIRVNESVDRMTHLIEQLLSLYRVEPDQYGGNHELFDLYGFVKEYIASNYSVFSREDHEIEMHGEHAEIFGDQFAITLLLKNILDNAAKYTPKGGAIRCTISDEEEETLLQIEDSGPGIPEPDIERVFQRFYRIGGDQHNSGVQGCGLGLSIVKHIASLHHAKISLSKSTLLGGLSITVAFPKKKANK